MRGFVVKWDRKLETLHAGCDSVQSLAQCSVLQSTLFQLLEYQTDVRRCRFYINLAHCSACTWLTHVHWQHRAWFNACGNHNGQPTPICEIVLFLGLLAFWSLCLLCLVSQPALMDIPVVTITIQSDRTRIASTYDYCKMRKNCLKTVNKI